MDETKTGSRGPRGKAADTGAENSAADTGAADTGASTPREVQMHRAVHELRTGPDPDDKIDGGTLITEELAAEHDLDEDQLDKLVDAGAVDLVDVLVR